MNRNPYLIALGLLALSLTVVALGTWVLAQMTPDLSVRAGMFGFAGLMVGAAAPTALAWLVAGAVAWKPPAD